jgi:hypothetical protein
LFGRADDFGSAAGRAGDSTDASAGDDFGGFVIGLDEQVVEAFLTYWN